MNDQASGGGMGCCTVLFLIFLVLKLTHNIDWSWWCVTAPLWLPFFIVIAILVIVGIVAVLAGLADR